MSLATDHALATIASILDQPQPSPGLDKPPYSVKPAEPDNLSKPAAPIKPMPPAPVDANGYAKTGPGPMAAIRFKWTARRGDDGYYVDETIGTGSVPVTSGPMSAEAAIKFVDERASEAGLRFEALKNEMTGQGPMAPILIPGIGEK
jgi:hypothetical protein